MQEEGLSCRDYIAVLASGWYADDFSHGDLVVARHGFDGRNSFIHHIVSASNETSASSI